MASGQEDLTLTVNGAVHRLPAGSTVLDLLRTLGVPADQAAVERNGDVVPRREHGAQLLGDGDTIEVLTFVGGG